MKLSIKPVLAAGIAMASIAFATSAQAQTAGIATSVPEAVLAQSQARQTAYQQINQTYSAQIQQVRGMRGELNTLQQSLDTNGDNQLSEEEARANPAVLQQIQQKQQQVDAVLQPIRVAQAYAIDQVLAGYGAARQQVIQQKGIQIMLAREAIQYAPEGTDVTQDIVTSLNQSLPAVNATPPANYQPSRTAADMHAAIEQLMLVAAQRQAQQQQQQGAQQQPSQPSQPSGR